MKKVALKEAVERYWVNGYRGWKEVKSGLFLQIKDPCTINKHLDGEIVTQCNQAGIHEKESSCVRNQILTVSMFQMVLPREGAKKSSGKEMRSSESALPGKAV